MEKFVKKLKGLFNIKFIKDVATLQSGMILTMCISFVTTILMARILHPENYGIYALIFSLYGSISLLGNIGIVNIGVVKATVIRLTEAYALGNRKEIVNLLAFYMKTSLIIGLIMLMLSFFLLPFLTDFLYGSRKIGNLARLLFLMAPLGIFNGLVAMSFQSLRMMKRLTILENSVWIIRSILIILLLIWGLGVEGVVYGSIAGSLFSSIIAVMMYKKIHPKVINMPSLGEVLKKTRQVAVSKYLKFGFLISLDKNIYNLFWLLPVVVLGRFADYSRVGYFKLAMDLVSQPVNLLLPIYRNLDAKLPQVLLRQGAKKLYQSFLKVSLISGVIATAISAILLIVIPHLIIYFYGTEYIPATKVAYVFLIYLITSGFAIGLGSLYRTLRKVGMAIQVKLVTLIFIFPAGLWLIKVGGVVGAATFYNSLILISSAVLFILSCRWLRKESLQT